MPSILPSRKDSANLPATPLALHSWKHVVHTSNEEVSTSHLSSVESSEETSEEIFMELSAETDSSEHDQIMTEGSFGSIICKLGDFISSLENQEGKEPILPTPLLTALHTQTMQCGSQLFDMPKESLMRLFNLLQWQIDVQLCRLDEENEANEPATCSSEFAVVMASLQCCCITLRIMTLPNAPVYALVEELIEKIARLGSYYLNETLIPVPTTEEESKKSSPTVSPKKEKVSSAKRKEENRVQLKLAELMQYCQGLVSRVKLTDTTVLHLTSLSLPVFFHKHLSALHLRAMDLVRAIFAHYTDHRHAILQELFVLLLQLPTSKRSLRKYKIVGQGTKVQMITALLLQLTQSCATQLHDQEAMTIGRTMVNLFLQKCKGPEHANEYRTMLDNFIVDLVNLVYLPEWPAAEHLLVVLAASLSNILNSTAAASLKNGGLPVSEASNRKTEGMRLMALKQLGIIGTTFASVVAEQEKSRLFEKKNHVEPRPDAVPSDPDQDASCVCMQGYQKRFMLDCDRCHVWFHGECVGISASDVPDSWYCDSCSILREMETRTSATPQLESTRAASDNAVEQQAISAELVSNFLTQRSNQNAQFAKSYFLNTFHRSFPLVMTTETVDSLLQQEYRRGAPLLVLSYRGTSSLLQYLSVCRDLPTRFQLILHAVFGMCSDKQVTFRAQALKALSSMIEANPQLLGTKSVIKVIQERRMDVSVSVRQAVVDLVGRFILSSDDLLTKYHQMVLDRIADTGVSVRKRVLKTLREICLQERTGPLVEEICTKLVSRLRDEEAIRTLVLRTFEELWFGETNETQLPSDETLQARLSQIFAVIGVTSQHTWFIQLMRSLLEREGDKGGRIRAQVEQMIRLIIHEMISLEENSGDEQCAPLLLPKVSVLHLFCQSEPTLMQRHLLIIQPYLQIRYTDSEGAQLHKFIIEIFEHAMPTKKGQVSVDTLLGLEEDLSQVIHNHSSMKVVQAAVKCLCVIVVNLSNHTVFLEELLDSFMSSLTDEKTLEPAASMRFLFSTGLLIRYFDFDLARTSGRSRKSGGARPPSVMAFEMLLRYLEGDHSVPVRIKALQGLGHLMVRNPSLMNKCNKLFCSIFRSNNLTFKTHLLRNFGDFLTQDQQCVEGHLVNVQPVRDRTDGGPRAIQTHLDSFLPLLVHPTGELRMDAIVVVGQLLQHGLAHPLRVVSYFVALLSDRMSTMREQAFRWLLFIYERNPGLLLTRLGDGVILSFHFQRRVFQHVNAMTLSDISQGPTSILSDLYRLYRSKRTTRDEFLQAIISLMEDSERNGSLQKYLGDLIAYLPFEVIGEPLSLIHALDRIIALRTGASLKAFKEALKSEDEKEIHRECHSACLSIILIKLKAFLKWGYSLSTSSCDNYVPSDPANNSPCVKIFDPSSVLSPFSGIPILGERATVTITPELASQQYQLLKSLFSQDDADSYTEGAPRPTQKRARRSSTRQAKASRKRRRPQEDSEEETSEEVTESTEESVEEANPRKRRRRS